MQTLAMAAEDSNEARTHHETAHCEKSAAPGTDIFRDTPVRLLGYANEVGEAFRSLVHVNVVRLSYAVASAYVVVDTADKVLKADKVKCPDAKAHRNKLFNTAVDTLVWQALASVIIPGFTINRVCALSLFLLKRYSSMPLNACKWTTTGVGLGCIPFIVSPIDHGVHVLMDKTLRQWLHAKESSD
ncbi:mitochondrial fission process protein 1 [Rhipicephalus microplus]|uniref:mitochondrial fission process protein 1 n=1 Tax=Rhipicephalus microplus TaxID=6941 RepID=UPI003F6B1CF8